MSADTKQFTCIVCPIGCRVSVEMRDSEFIFTGNRCKRGAEFAKIELTAPMRSLTTTVRTIFPEVPVLPVRTKGEVPKKAIPALMAELSKVLVKRRIGIGAVVVHDVFGTDVIATSDVLNECAK